MQSDVHITIKNNMSIFHNFLGPDPIHNRNHQLLWTCAPSENHLFWCIFCLNRSKIYIFAKNHRNSGLNIQKVPLGSSNIYTNVIFHQNCFILQKKKNGRPGPLIFYLQYPMEYQNFLWSIFLALCTLCENFNLIG